MGAEQQLFTDLLGPPEGCVVCEQCRNDVPEDVALNLGETCCRRAACIRDSLPEGWYFDDSDDATLAIAAPVPGGLRSNLFPATDEGYEQLAEFVRGNQ